MCSALLLLLALALALLCGGARAQAATLRVTAPAEGAELRSGFKAVLEWESSGLRADAPVVVVVVEAKKFSIGSVDLFDLRDEEVARLETTNSGRAELFVPLVERDSDRYYAEIFSRVDKTVHARVAFSVKAVDYEIALTAPTPGAVLRAGEPVALAWLSTNVPPDAPLRVALLRKRAGFAGVWERTERVADVADAAPNTGALEWSVPLSVAAGAHYVFELVYADGYRVETGELSIEPGSKTLAVLAPAAELAWLRVGTQKTVEWRAAGFAAGTALDIELWRIRSGAQARVAPLAAAVDAAAGRAYVDVPAAAEPGLHFVKLLVTGQPSLFADSEPFQIADLDDADAGIYTGADDNAILRTYMRKIGPANTAARTAATATTTAALTFAMLFL